MEPSRCSRRLRGRRAPGGGRGGAAIASCPRLMPRRCDIWRIGIVAAPVETIARHGLPTNVPVTWLPAGRSFTFDADPFGRWHDGVLHIFVEHYDYRSRRGVIDCLVLDPAFRIVERHRVIEETWHLSYPVLFEAEGALWMLPESYRSGAANLYRCRRFPFEWERVRALPVDGGLIDATPFHHDGRWWLFYSSAGDRDHRLGSLHALWSDRIAGPWRTPGVDPVRLDRSGARPAGRPFVLDGRPVLPVQDCARTYGGAVRLAVIDRLDPGGVSVTIGRRIGPEPEWRPFDRGLHTLSGCGPVTLIDAKRIDRSGRGWLIDAARMFRQAIR